MATIKKKYFKKRNKEEQDLEELVDKDGAPISGDHTRVSNSEIETGPTIGTDDEADKGISPTTDDIAKMAMQKRRWPLFGSNYSSGKRVAMPESHKILAKERMGELIEDLMDKKSDNYDMVKNKSNQDINRNDVPDIDDITSKNQALANKAKELIRIMGTQSISGDEVGVLLNYIVSNLNTDEIPQDYKKIIKNKI